MIVSLLAPGPPEVIHSCLLEDLSYFASLYLSVTYEAAAENMPVSACDQSAP